NPHITIICGGSGAHAWCILDSQTGLLVKSPSLKFSSKWTIVSLNIVLVVSGEPIEILENNKFSKKNSVI
ncbi:MAG: hypothetical protein K8S16_00160, partial [Bacteroidales bacterium]|nr:hypothetical protein [Bacteroidales bacterium]